MTSCVDRYQKIITQIKYGKEQDKNIALGQYIKNLFSHISIAMTLHRDTHAQKGRSFACFEKLFSFSSRERGWGFSYEG